jgi:hypothetical protein
LEAVLMVQTAEDRLADHRSPVARSEPSRAVRWLHAQAAVGTVMVVADVMPEDLLGVALVPHEHVVEAVPPEGAGNPSAKAFALGDCGGVTSWRIPSARMRVEKASP